MKTLIYGDVHGNLPAFEKMLKVENDCENFICLGDLVNYGPWSNECVDLAISLPNSRLLMGNHEEAFIDGEYPGTNSMVQDFFKKTYNNFKRKKEIMLFLTETEIDKFVCRHTILNTYIYPDTTIQLDNNYIIGHSHHQFNYASNNFVLYNAGSVGQNRKYINQINYLIYDSDKKSVTMKSILYDINTLLNEMRILSYPKDCIDYYDLKEKL